MRFLNVGQEVGYVCLCDLWFTRGDLQPQLKRLVYKKDRPCGVCALGACFLSHVNLYNEFKIPDDSSAIASGDFQSVLAASMGGRNLILIEDAFELRPVAERRGDVWMPRYEYDELDGKAKRDCLARISATRFGQKYTDSPDRLRAILKNLIANNGEFIPPPVKIGA
jgi:hypothetical protein